ncbi:helix-turn-helix domain-containing protein [Alsobacter soli]|nr:helix-turn-helix domain-containing protein [Alsobacter soli]
MAVIGQVHLRAVLDAGQDGAVRPRAIPAPRGISASRIADTTGLSRQTVRRKLAKLEARGWIELKGRGMWILALRNGVSLARSDVDDLDHRSMERVLRLAERFARIRPGT